MQEPYPTMQNTLPMLQQDTTSAASGNCLPVGARLADFEITGIVGEGGFGIVYLAFDHSLQRTVAIKEYMPAMFASRGADKSVMVRSVRDKDTFATGLKSFINEARLLAQFNHPALIKVYRFWEENNTGYMAMQYYEGQTLKNVLRKDPALVSEAWLKGILKPILEALDTLYRVNVLHRDISPENIMIQRTGEAVLLDFGAARQIIGDMAHSFTVILKPGYAPIEQYAGDDGMAQGPWTDIYSLSAVIYFVIAKKLPPTSVGRMIKDPIEPLAQGDFPGFSKEFLSAIDKGLAVKPDERPQSIDEFRRLLKLELAVPMPMGPAGPDLHSIPSFGRNMENAGKAGSSSGASARRTAAKRRNNLLLGLSIAGIVCGTGAVGYFLFTQASTARPNVAAAAIADEARILPVSAAGSATAAMQTATGSPNATAFPDQETAAWHALREKPDATQDEWAGFLQTYPEGQYAALARARLEGMKAGQVASEAASVEKKRTAPVQAKPGAKPEKQAAGLVRLNVRPWGEVSVNGISKGVSPPLKQLSLPEGKHYLKFENTNFPDYFIEVDVAKKKAVTVDYDFSKPRK